MAEALEESGGGEAERCLERLLESKRGAETSGISASSAASARSAARALVSADPGPEQLQQAAVAVAEMLERARDAKDKAAQGHLLVAASHLDLARDAPGPALKAAEEARELFGAIGEAEAKGLAAALEAAFWAQQATGSPLAGIRVANKELEAAGQRGDRRTEVAVAEMLAHAHASIGEPQSAIRAAKRAVELHRALGDKEAEGSALHLIAEMRWALNEHAEAAEVARQALAAFSEAKCKAGEERALATISSLMAARGLVEKAPNRQEALKALKDLAQAVEARNAEDMKSAEERLNAMRDLVSDQEVVGQLSPIMEQDPGATAFLKEQGWNLGGAEGYEGTLIKQYSHQAFYLTTTLTGMNFGPQFRAVHPFRLGRKPEEMLALEVAQLEETEAWQMEMGFRPGIMDSMPQSMTVMMFP